MKFKHYTERHNETLVDVNGRKLGRIHTQIHENQSVYSKKKKNVGTGRTQITNTRNYPKYKNLKINEILFTTNPNCRVVACNRFNVNISYSVNPP